MTLAAVKSDRSRTQAHRSPKNPGKAVRVEQIARLMETGGWKGPKGYPELAKRWGVTVDTIEHDACEAARMLRRCISDEDVKEWADAHLAHISECARATADYSNARGAIRDRLDARGLLISKQQTTVSLERVSDPDLLKAALVEVCATEEGRKLVLEKAREIQTKGKA